MLHHQLPWYIGGPVLGFCVIALRLLLNGRLGVTGGLSGTSMLSPASLVATAAFFGTAIAVSFLIEAVI